jgi:hypothetical protein
MFKDDLLQLLGLESVVVIEKYPDTASQQPTAPTEQADLLSHVCAMTESQDNTSGKEDGVRDSHGLGLVARYGRRQLPNLPSPIPPQQRPTRVILTAKKTVTGDANGLAIDPLPTSNLCNGSVSRFSS